MNKQESHLKKSYTGKQKILVAVDCIIFGVQQNNLHLLLFKREVEPLAGEWSLIGSFIKQDEAVDQAARRILREITGLEELYMKQLHCFGEPERDPGDRVISIVYWSLIKIDQNNLQFSTDHHVAKWVGLKNIPNLILDHRDMVNAAIHQLRKEALFYPIGFELLPKEFTLRQMLEVYEAIFDSQIDDRNFRKKILGSGLLQDLKKKDKSTSKKGSYLYCFNKNRYTQLQEQGFHFDFGFRSTQAGT